MLNFCGIVVAILKMETGRNFSMSGINSRHWNRTMLNLCGIVMAILKMATGKNCSMTGINSRHHYLPTYKILMISDNVEFLAVLWWPFWKWRPVEIFQCRESILGHHYLPTYIILMISDNVEFLPPIFYAVFWQPF